MEHFNESCCEQDSKDPRKVKAACKQIDRDDFSSPEEKAYALNVVATSIGREVADEILARRPDIFQIESWTHITT